MSPLELSRRLLEQLARAGAGFAAHAPGARNLPLLAALREQPQLERMECVDERAAGYLALGWIRGRALAGAGLPPALVICTSGGAALNLLPAAAEATESGLPLILLTADRPAEEIGRGANQTVDQVSPFQTLVRAQLRITGAEPGWEDALAQALVALRREPGALQLNLAFREPLLRDDERTPKPLAAPGWRSIPAPTEELRQLDLSREWAAGPARAQRGLVWVCDLPRLEDRQAARALAVRLGWPLLADGGSGVWGREPGGPLILRHGEALLPQLSRCDFVLQLGKRPVSRRLLETLHACPGVVVDEHAGLQDPLGLDRPRWRCRPAELLVTVEREAWPATAAAAPDWDRELEQAQFLAAARRDRALLPEPRLSEALAVRRLLLQLPADGGLFVGNSLPVRLLDQWLCGLEQDRLVAGNRGLSGIDGQLACALGLQRGLGRPTAALLGDLSLLHDFSSLALWAREQIPLLALVLHNDGGGIFRLHADSAALPWTVSPHGLPLAEPARALGLDARRVEDLEELDSLLEGWRETPRPLLLEVRVDGGDHARRVAALATTRLRPAVSPEPARRVWLHGFLGCPEDWDPVRSELGAPPGVSPAYVSELAPWLPGHGEHPTEVPESLDAWVDRLQAELGGTDPLELIGYSLGGRLALRLALRLPERVRRLVLLGASPGLESAAERSRRLEVDSERAARLCSGGLADFVVDWYRQPLFQSFLERPEAAGWLERRSRGRAEALAQALVAASPGALPSLWPRLPELPMPVLWLAGERDVAYSASSRRAAARCPRGACALVAGAGHAAQLEEPGATAERIRAFLDADDEHTNQGDVR